MKNLKLFAAFLCIVSFSLQSCMKDKCTSEHTYIKYTPVYKTMEEMTVDIKSESPRELVQPGKIYFYNNYIFINEIKEGIHVIDNSDPENPQNIAFINIPGNVDMAIKDNVLIGDSYLFLLTVDVSDPLNVQLIGRQEQWNYNFPQDASGSFVVDYTEEEVTETVDCNGSHMYRETAFDASFLSNSTGATQTSTGVGGSMARFTIYDQYLYAVDMHYMKVVDISDLSNPTEEKSIYIGSDIETIFPYGDKLFIGSRSGMFIYDNADPLNPVQLGVFEHARACDPVFVKDNYAYVTLHSDNISCGGFTDQLDLIDITDLTNPFLVETFQMDNPHGLSIKGDNLFICEGDFGLKTFDISDPATLNERLVSHLENFSTYDVISIPGNENILLVIGDDGFYQFNFDDPTQLKQLSHIPVMRK
jgi:hypothetical protein